jgi:hypothetical protein
VAATGFIAAPPRHIEIGPVGRKIMTVSVYNENRNETWVL